MVEVGAMFETSPSPVLLVEPVIEMGALPVDVTVAP
jgi:hypothetical protein